MVEVDWGCGDKCACQWSHPHSSSTQRGRPISVIESWWETPALAPLINNSSTRGVTQRSSLAWISQLSCYGCTCDPVSCTDASLPFVALQLLAPPVRLVSAALWKVMKQRDVLQYGVVEEFVTSACETVPGLLTVRHQGKLALGLRGRVSFTEDENSGLDVLPPQCQSQFQSPFDRYIITFQH